MTRLLSFGVPLLLRLDFAHASGGWLYAEPGATAADAKTQAETWSGLCVSGREQSPIDIVTANTVKTSKPLIETHLSANTTYVKNTGHGLQVFETSPDVSVFNISEGDHISEVPSSYGDKGYSMISGSVYNFYQVHWHTPSENTINGKYYAAEAHFVHQLDDEALVGTTHRLAVIGLLYEISPECNTFLDKFWGTFPDAAGVAQYNGTVLDFNNQLTQALSSGYYHWYGSLTTPPCTEGVSWNLLKLPQKICQRQVDKLKTALETAQHLPFNNRVPQPLYNRVVTEAAPDGPHWPPVQLPPALNEEHWVYAQAGDAATNATAQEETWGGLCITGQEQSPINIVTGMAKMTQTPGITAQFNVDTTYVKNTGHSFQLHETSPDLKSILANGTLVTTRSGLGSKGYSTIHNTKFNFYQVHWHTPSENTIDGQSSIMEAHFVHQLDDIALVGTTHRLAVVALLYDLGSDAECNPLLDKFWDTFPIDAGTAPYTGTAIDLNQELTNLLAQGYYHWYGSLTTPPCTEGVDWNLLKRREKVCQKQVDRLKLALGQTQHGVPFNNRAVQPLYARVVTLSEPVAVVTPVSPATATGTSLASLLILLHLLVVQRLRDAV